MEIEKLIEQLQKSADFEDYPVVASFAAIIEKKYLREAATALESLRVLQPKVETNADRIRAMSDHDLAVFLEHAMYDSSEPDWMTVLSWLQQPAEEEP